MLSPWAAPKESAFWFFTLAAFGLPPAVSGGTEYVGVTVEQAVNMKVVNTTRAEHFAPFDIEIIMIFLCLFEKDAEQRAAKWRLRNQNPKALNSVQIKQRISGGGGGKSDVRQ
ncbi:MAG TPA: hypothetical protein PLO23_02555 [Alphaproteobacteria bacterium]|nr:hypothetical protein [Alphaproteobacteria bacterium]